MELTVIMPVYNEIACIEAVIEEWIEQLSSMPHSASLLVVNDGSTDGTKEVLEKLKEQIKNLMVIHQENGGHGQALLTGYKYCLQTSSKYIFQVDSDGQFFPQDILKLWEKKDQLDYIIGIRENRQDGLLRNIISKTLSYILYIVFNVKINDPNIPFRLSTKACLSELLANIPINSFAPNIFLSIEAYKKNKDIGNVYVKHKTRSAGMGHLNIFKLTKACLSSTLQLLKYRLGMLK